MEETLPFSPPALYTLAALLMISGTGLLWFARYLSPKRRLEGAAAWTGATFGAVVILAGLVLATLTYTRHTQPEALLPPGAVGRPAPELRFRLVATDEPRTLADYRGQIIVLNLWATWCSPCLEEIPELNRLQQTYRDQGIVVIMISDETRQTILEFMKDHPIEAVSGYLPQDARWPWPYNRVEQARPTTFIIDREGIIRATWPGAANFTQFEAAVLELQ